MDNQQLHSYSLREQSSAQKALCTICSGRWERCLHIGGREGQAALNPVLNNLASFLNYSTHGRSTKSRNRNNKELICLKPIRFYTHST